MLFLPYYAYVFSSKKLEIRAVGKHEPSYIAGGNASWCNYSGKNLKTS
jgi:hypothetical protein